MPFRYTACGSQISTSRDPLKSYAIAKRNEIRFEKGLKMAPFTMNLTAIISVKRKRADR